MLAGWVMSAVLGNEIRFADEILPGGQDDIGTLCRRNPLLRSGRGNKRPRIRARRMRGKLDNPGKRIIFILLQRRIRQIPRRNLVLRTS